MKLSCNLVWRVVMVWGLALALMLAPLSGASPVQGHAMAASSSGAMAGADPGSHHDCDRMGKMPSGADGPVALNLHPDEQPASQQKQMSCCDDLCLMACHAILMLPSAFVLPVAVARAHETHAIQGLKTQGPNVLLPPPRTGV